MSTKHPIIAVTGSSGAGTTTVQQAFARVFEREGIRPAFVAGDAFRRYDRKEMREAHSRARQEGQLFSHFGPAANLFDRLEGLFREYSRTGGGLTRRYLTDPEEAAQAECPPGSFTPWEPLPDQSDLLFYEGLHGGCTEATWSRREMSDSHNPFVVQVRHQLRQRLDYGIDIAKWVDLLIGVVPAINLEWIQKIHHDCARKHCSPEAVVETIVRRMPDYVRYIVPQFSLTDINFQRMPLVDTSNPFVAREIPSPSESVVVIRFREPKRFHMPDLLQRIPGALLSRPNTLVVPGGEMEHAMEVICTPLVQELVARRAGI